MWTRRGMADRKQTLSLQFSLEKGLQWYIDGQTGQTLYFLYWLLKPNTQLYPFSSTADVMWTKCLCLAPLQSEINCCIIKLCPESSLRKCACKSFCGVSHPRDQCAVSSNYFSFPGAALRAIRWKTAWTPCFQNTSEPSRVDNGDTKTHRHTRRIELNESMKYSRNHLLCLDMFTGNK